MSKTEILSALIASGEVPQEGSPSGFRRSANWDKAFDLYNKTTGQHKHQNCGSCYRDVLAWLRN